MSSKLTFSAAWTLAGGCLVGPHVGPPWWVLWWVLTVLMKDTGSKIFQIAVLEMIQQVMTITNKGA